MNPFGIVIGSASALDSVEYSFTRQPAPVPADLRTERRVPLLLVLLDKAWGGRATWTGLHVLNWVIREKTHAEMFAEHRSGRDLPHVPVVRFDPALDRAVDIAIGLGLVEITGTTIRLTDAGRAALQQVRSHELFQRERDLLATLAGKVTQTEVEQFLAVRTR